MSKSPSLTPVKKPSVSSLSRGVANIIVSPNGASRGSGSGSADKLGALPSLTLGSSASRDKDKSPPAVDTTGARRRLSVMGADARTVDGADRTPSPSSSPSPSPAPPADEAKLPASATRRRLSVMGAANAGVEYLDGIADPTGESKIDKLKMARSASISMDPPRSPSITGFLKSADATVTPLKKKKLFSHFVVHSKVGYVPFNPHKVNQDRPMEVPKFGGHDDRALFGVFDGHGALGHEVSSFLIKDIPLRFLSQKNLDTETEKAIETAFLESNERLANGPIDCMYSGSTGIVVYICGKKLFSCNAGDSRAVLAKMVGEKMTAVALSDDQKPDRPDEKKRILEARGRVEACKGARGEDIGPPRVWLTHQDVPGLAMSRSFGDLIAASVGVIARPEVWERELEPNDRFFILASDGVWEFISNQEAVDIVHKYCGDKGQHAEEAVKQLVESVRRWNREEEVVDDITAVIVFF